MYSRRNYVRYKMQLSFALMPNVWDMGFQVGLWFYSIASKIVDSGGMGERKLKENKNEKKSFPVP